MSRFLSLLLVLVASSVQACDYGQALGRFAAPCAPQMSYAPAAFDVGCAPAAFSQSYGFQSQAVHVQRFAAPVYQRQAFAPVYQQRFFLQRAFAPAYQAPALQFNLFNRQRVVNRQRSVIRQRGFQAGAAFGY